MKQILKLYVLKTRGGLGALVFFFMVLRSLNELLLGFGSLIVAAVCYLGATDWEREDKHSGPQTPRGP